MYLQGKERAPPVDFLKVFEIKGQLEQCQCRASWLHEAVILLYFPAVRRRIHNTLDGRFITFCISTQKPDSYFDNLVTWINKS